MSEENISVATFQNIKRGEIYFYACGQRMGSEQGGMRPCIIVSNNKNNEYAPIVTIIPLTTQEKKPIPTHTYIDIESVYGHALAEQITTISKLRLLEYVGEIGEATQRKIDRILKIQLDLERPTEHALAVTPAAIVTPPETITTPIVMPPPTAIVTPQNHAENALLLDKVKTLEVERNIYKDLYNNLLEKSLNGSVRT